MIYFKVNNKIAIKLKSKLVDIDLFENKSNEAQTLLITINNVSKLNAINNDILDDLIYIFNHYINSDNYVRSIILTGAGDKAFIAGADIKLMSTYSPSQAYDYSKKGQKLISLILTSSKPIIGAINGYALGGGCEIASACHFRYAKPNSIFGQPEVKLGIIAGWGGTQNLPRIVGMSHALELLLTGNTINAEKAHKIGLINEIIKDDFLNKVLNISFKINENSPNALQNTLKAVYDENIIKGLDIEAKLFKNSFKHKDSKVGLKSFLKKEKPNF